MHLPALASSLLLLDLCVLAAPPPKEILQFLRPILERETQAAGDVWSATNSGGYIFRFDLDLNGDDLPELFVGSSLYSWQSRVSFKIYQGLADGHYQAFPAEGLNSQVSVDGGELWLQELAPGREAIVTFSRDRMVHYVTSYTASGSRLEISKSVTDQDTVYQIQAAPEIRRFQPKIYGILLADFLRDPQKPWRHIDFEKPSRKGSDYFIAAEDEETIGRLANFTPELALQWLKSAEAGEPPDVNPTFRPAAAADLTPLASFLPEPTPSSSVTLPADDLVAPTEQPKGIWLIITCALVGIMSLVYMLRRDRPQR